MHIGGGLLGSKWGTWVGRNLRNGGGPEYSGSCLGVLTLRRFICQRGGAVGVPALVAPKISGGSGGGVGGGGPGGLAAFLEEGAPLSL